ncbi:hypothetical protein G6F57_021488 [Rhizopus arrhizus]|nr:hypothetical protein G6F23_014904 [Rhizopus arrhizus]KAG1434649.1 hypothetical protein G6F57_021488 [Rhizopus arrhizus]
MPSTASACHRRATVLALAISTVLLPLAGVPTAQAQPAVVAPLRQYAIPEQPLADAVRAFGRQADAQVVFRSDLVEGRRSSARRARTTRHGRHLEPACRSGGG